MKFGLVLVGFLSMAASDLSAADNLTEIEARERAVRVSEVSYDVSLSFTSGGESYRGQVEAHFAMSDPAKPIQLDFRSSGIRKASSNGHELDRSAADGSRVTIPASTLKRGENLVTIEYENTFDRGGSGIVRNVDASDSRQYIYTDFEPYFAHRLIPCFDQPDLKAVFRLLVTAPEGWTVVANSPERRTIPDGKGATTHEFEPTPRLATYLFFVGAGEYQIFSDAAAGKIPSRLLARQSMAKYVDTEELFDMTRRGLAYYEEYFGVPYPFAKYDQIFVPDYNSGAMENAGAVTYQESFLFRHAPTTRERLERAEYILHEMAHMWFGDLVTMRWWDGLWLNESFASYMSDLALVEATPFKEAFEEFLTSQKVPGYRADQLPTTHPVSGTVTDTNTAFSNFDDITYAKGASLLKQLAFFVGPEQFKAGLRDYFRKHAWGNTDTSDFLASLSGASKVDLSEWRKLHLETSGVNTLVPRIESGGGKVLSLTIEQKPGNGDARLRPHRLEVALYTAGTDGHLSLWKAVPVTVEGTSTRVAEVLGAPTPAFVWANHGDQAYARVFLDPMSLAYARGHLERLPDGLTRRGVWMTFWEMVRDGELSPNAFVDTFTAKAPLERDPKIIESLFRMVRTALFHYLDRSRDAATRQVEKLAWSQLEKAPAGSDVQKNWFELAVDTSIDPEALERIEAFLDGHRHLTGLVLDPEKRWEMTIQLCGFGRPGAAKRVAAELKRDATDAGKRQALLAEASLPEPVVKERYFVRAIEDEKLTIEQLRSVATGMIWSNQSALYRPYVERFFEALPLLRKKRDPEYVDAFAGSLFPANVHEQATLERTRAFLAANADLPDDLRRPLLNEADELERCLRIRAKDR